MKNIIIVLLLAAVIGGGVYFVSTQQQSAVTPQMASAGPDQAAAITQNSEVAKLLSAQGLVYDKFLKLIGSLNKTQRDAVLADKELFTRLVNQEALRLSFIDAANTSQFASNEKIQYLMARQADDFLINSYINDRLNAAGVPEDFPDEQQIQQFYENNKQHFTLSERLPVWQVFWRTAETASKPEVAKLIKQASLVSADLTKGKITFEQAAMEYSQHGASRLQGGYMGVLQTADLRPQIKEKLLGLKVSSISKPIRSEDGVHVFRRGATLSAEILPLSAVRPQVISALEKALRTQQRAQLNQLVQSEYPVKTDATPIADWMQKMASFYSQLESKKPQ